MTARSLHVAPLHRATGPTVRDAVMQLLTELGLTTIFGNPGSTELPMFRDLPDHFSYILGLQESVVLGMADGYAQATGKAAMVNLHSSAGLGHAMGNLFTAYRNGTPLVVTAGQQARSILPYAPFLYAERATEMPQPFVKWAIEPARAEDVPLAIARAYHVAMQAPRGPVFVSVPIDDWDRPCAPVSVARIASRTSPDPDMMDEIVAMIDSASKIAIVGGAGVANNGARDLLVVLADRLGADVWAAPMAARNPFPEDHARFGGFLAASREAIVHDLDGCDLILVLGAPVFTFHVEGSGPFIPAGARLVHIGDDPSVASRAPEGLAVVGDLALALGLLCDRVAARTSQGAPSPRSHKVSLPPADRLTDALLMARLSDLRPRSIAIVEEAPSTRGPMHDLFPVRTGDEFYTCASGGLGHGLPAAVGVALGRPGQPVLCLLGDGSAMYSPQGLWTAATYGADVRFIIVNNGGYAALEQFGALFGMEVVGSKLTGIDFVQLAHSQGVPAARVSSPDALDAAIVDLFDGTGPKLLEVIVAPVGQEAR